MVSHNLTVILKTNISIGTLNPNQAKTITFQVQVTSVPPNGIIENQGQCII